MDPWLLKKWAIALLNDGRCLYSWIRAYLVVCLLSACGRSERTERNVWSEASKMLLQELKILMINVQGIHLHQKNKEVRSALADNGTAIARRQVV